MAVTPGCGNKKSGIHKERQGGRVEVARENREHGTLI
jgi:hypothetical protein